MATIHETSASAGRPASGMAMTRSPRIIDMSIEADDFVADLARRTGHEEGEVLRLALGMFKMAVDAKEQGKHVGVAATSDALEIELVGF